MIRFIFFITIVVLVLLILAFRFKSYILMMLSSLGMMVIGVDMLANNIVGINNILTLALGIIFTCVGFYVFINSSLEKFKEFD